MPETPIDEKPSSWIRRIDHAKEQIERHLQDWDYAKERRHGPKYRTKGKNNEIDLENHAHEWHSLMGPQLSANAPRVRVTTSRGGEVRSGAVALGLAMNRWSAAYNLEELNERFTEDYGEYWCVAHVGPGREGFGPLDMKSTPVVTRISPRHFIWDTDALEIAKCRFLGHMVERDGEELLAHAESKQGKKEGWDSDAVQQLLDRGREEYREKSNDPSMPEYQTIVYWEIWSPGGKNKDGEHNGWLYTIGQGQDANGDSSKFLRKRREFWGPRKGPYKMWGAHVVMDEVAPLSPIVASRVQVAELNAHARATSGSAADYKKMYLIDDADPELASKITGTDHHGVVTSNLGEDIRKKVVELEIGGVTQQMIAHTQIAKDRVDRTSGTFEAQRGNVEGVGTATEVNAASQASGHRVGHDKTKFRMGVLGYMEIAAWYFVVDRDVEAGLGSAGNDQFVSMDTGEPGEAIWTGGDPVADFDAYEFQLELYAMDRTDETANDMRVLALTELSQMDAPAMLASPFLDWEEITRIKGEARGIPELPSLVDFDMMRTLAAMMIGQQQAMAEPQQTSPAQPRLTGNTFGSPGRAQPAGGKREASSRMLGRGSGAGPDAALAAPPATNGNGAI